MAKRNKKQKETAQDREMLTYVSPSDGRFRRAMIRMIENLAGRRKIAPYYQQIRQKDLSGREVWPTSLEVLKLRTHFAPEAIAKIPKTGPLVFVANHPFGVVDGLVLGSLAATVREKFHFLVYESLIHQDPRLEEFLLPIDFRETKEALQTNLATRKASLERLAQGEALVIFPGGGVATAKNGVGKLREFEWKRFVASVIQKSQATVVPVFFHGQNSRAFHLVSQVSPTLRLGMQLHEIKKKIGKEIKLEIGDPIPYEELQPLKGRQEILDHLFEVVMDLGGDSRKKYRDDTIKG